jgi:hypothetical protein
MFVQLISAEAADPDGLWAAIDWWAPSCRLGLNFSETAMGSATPRAQIQ